ncbi:MAG: hypothetical protein SGPRY_013146 [Prymnesium sp.]
MEEEGEEGAYEASAGLHDAQGRRLHVLRDGEGCERCAYCLFEALDGVCDAPCHASVLAIEKSTRLLDEVELTPPLRTSCTGSALSWLRGDLVLSDLRVTTAEGSQHACHRVMLAASSAYFRSIFTSGMADAAAPVLVLPHVSYATFSAFLDFVYVGKCTLKRSALPALAQAAAFLEARELKAAVCVELCKEVSERSWLAAVEFGEQLGLSELVRHSVAIAMRALLAGRLATQLPSDSAGLLRAAELLGPDLLVALCREKQCESSVALLVAGGVDVNLMAFEGMEDDAEPYVTVPLFEASFRGSEALVALLIEAAADVNCGDSEGMSPLFIASQEGHVGCARQLLHAKASIELADVHGAQPLFVASQEGSHEIVALLLSEGACANAPRVADQRTPLYAACKTGCALSVSHLLQAKASTESQSEGRTPLQVHTLNATLACGLG